MSVRSLQADPVWRPPTETALDLDIDVIVCGDWAHSRGHDEWARGRYGHALTWLRIADLLENAEAQRDLVVLECNDGRALADCHLAPVAVGARRRSRVRVLVDGVRAALRAGTERLRGWADDTRTRRTGMIVWALGCLAGVAATASVGLSQADAPFEPSRQSPNLDLLAPLPEAQASPVPVDILGSTSAQPRHLAPAEGTGASPSPSAPVAEPDGSDTTPVPVPSWTGGPRTLTVVATAGRPATKGEWELQLATVRNWIFVATLSSAGGTECTWRFVGRSESGPVAGTPSVKVPSGDRHAIRFAVGDWLSMSALVRSELPRTCLLVGPRFVRPPEKGPVPAPTAEPSPTTEPDSTPSPDLGPRQRATATPSPSPGGTG